MLEDLLEHNAISERDYEQAQGDAQQSQAEVEAAREQVQVFGMDPDHASTQLLVKAPRAGVILDIGAAPGEFSQALSAPAPLATIADLTSVWAVGDIYEKDLSAAKSGEEAQVTLNAYPNQHWAGRVSVVSGAVDPATRTSESASSCRTTALVSNRHVRGDPHFAIFGARNSCTRVRCTREGNDAYVFVGKGNGRFERRAVKIGRTLDGSLEIFPV